MGMTLHTPMGFFFPRRDMTFATALLAQHLWGMSRAAEVGDVLGLGTGREGVAPKRIETITLVLKTLSSLALAGALVAAGGRG